MPEIVVEFVPDYSKIESGLQQLADNGAISKDFVNVFKQAQKPIDDLEKKLRSGSRNMGSDLDALRKKLSGISKSAAEGFKEGMADALKEAGVSLEEFEQALDAVVKKDKTLKQELKEVKEQLALLKLEGKENTEQFKQLIERAGQLSDTLADVALQTRKVGSDTRNIDSVIEVVQGLGAAYQIAQGAAALLGEDNEQLQAGLLRLQAIMAITTGIQQVANLLQKESNAIRLVTIIQTKALTASVNLQNAAQSKNIIISTLATGAMRLLNTVMKANPALLLVSAFAALAGALAFFSSSSKKAELTTDDLTDAIERQDRALSDLNDTITFNGKVRIERLKQQGASEATLFKAELEVKKQQLKNFEDAYERSQLNLTLFEDERRERAAKTQGSISKKERENANEREKILKEDLDKRKNDVLLQQREIQLSEEEFNTDQVRRAKEQSEKLSKAAAEAEQQRLQDIKTRIEIALASEREGTKQFLKLQVDLAAAEKNIGIFNAKSLAEKDKAIADFLVKVDKLTTDFYAEEERKALQAQEATLQAQLKNINLSAQERETLTVALLEKQRQLEIDEAVGNKQKEKEINARFDREIAEQRLQIRRDALELELREQSATGGVRQRALQAIVEDEQAAASKRIDSVNQLEEIEINAIKRKQEANEQYFESGLISAKEFTVTAAELKDQEALAHENAEKKKTDITKQESDKRKEKIKLEIEEILNIAAKLADTLGSINGVISAQEDARLDANRKALEELRKGGTITEKEFEERSRKLDLADRQAKRRQAEREKSIQLFQAFIAGARAIIEAAPDPFRIALTSFLVGAQLAAIAARPIPKFGKGTKHAPKGLAQVGETGTEIIKMAGGQYFVADHPQVIWLKGGERIYNPKETETIFKQRTPQADHTLTATTSISGGSQLSIDEDSLAKKIGAEISRHPRNHITLDEDGFTRHIEGNLYNATYRNKQFTFHD